MTNFYKILYALENVLPAYTEILMYDDVNDVIRAVSNGRYIYSGITGKARYMVSKGLKTISDTKGIPNDYTFNLFIGSDAFNPISDKKETEYTAVFTSEYGTIFLYGNALPFEWQIQQLEIVLKFANEMTKQLF